MRKSYTGRLKHSARILLEGKYGFCAAVTVFIALCNFLLNSILSSAFSGNGFFSLILQIGSSVLMNMIFYILLVGQHRLYLNLCRDEVYGYGDLLSSFTGRPEQIAIYSVLQFVLHTIFSNAVIYSAFQLLGANTTQLLLTIVGVIVGLILFVWVQISLYFVLYLFVDNPYISAKEAIQESIFMISGKRSKLIRIYLSFIGMYLLSLLSFGMGSVLVTPYINITMTLFYLEQRGEYSSDPE